MKIASSSVAMAAESQKTVASASYAYIRTDTMTPEQMNEINANPNPAANAGGQMSSQGDILNLSEASKAERLSRQFSSQKVEVKLILIRQMLEALNRDGKHSKLIDSLDKRLQDLEAFISGNYTQSSGFGQVSLNVQMGGQGRGSAQSVTFKQVTETYQSQSVSFDMSAQVKTADGKQISVDMSFHMSQEMYSRTETELSALRMVDPLVVNFDGPAAALSDEKFEFDLDQDGTSDQISYLGQGSGFLALDRNGDGKINDGGELFGTQSGDGFADLARYDHDGNGWIDESDAVFDKLRVWMKNDDGTDRLIALGEAGIGAVFLGNVATSYDLAGSQVNGAIRSTGFYLNENGTAGTMQHVDLAV